jgi:hypothetical protein
MKKRLLVALALLFMNITAGNIAAKQEDDSLPEVLKFHTMVGVAPPFTGGDNPIRGIPGGGLPWVLSEGRGLLQSDGTLKVKVRGLVIPVEPFNGTNPVENFRAIVSCLSVDEGGNPITVNVQTGLFPANTLGDSEIKETLDLPEPCIAPIIFVTSPGGAWFAATGL